MKRNTLNFWVDFISFLVMSGLIWTGLLIHYVLPPGTGGQHSGRKLTLLGLGRHDYGDIHFYMALAMIGLMVIHVWLHWAWVCGTVNKLLGTKAAGSARRAVYGVAVLVVMVALICGSLFWIKSRVNPANRADEQENIAHQSHSATLISGQITLVQAAKICGLSTEELVFQLQLPAEVDVNERLGRLKRRYGFEIEDVRKILEQNKRYSFLNNFILSALSLFCGFHVEYRA